MTASRDELLDLAQRVERKARELGADEATVTVSRSTSTSLARRDGKVEQATESTSRGLVFSVLLDERYSSHSTSDLRPQALDAFIERAVAATRYLEPDPERKLPDADLCGRGASEAELDQYDPAYDTRTADERAAHAERLERLLQERRLETTISQAVSIGDGSAETARVMSNGFADSHREAWFMLGGETTITDGQRRPESAAYFGARYLADLPDDAYVAQEVVDRAKERIGSRPIESGSYPLVLLNRATGKLLGTLAGPLSGGALHQGRSCLAGKLGERIGSDKLTIWDDPTIPRGLASRPWDGDGLRARPRAIVSEGVLDSYYINVYYGRKLDMPPTTGGRSNWVVPAGTRSWQEIARQWPKAILVDGFLGGNSNPVTGDFSFGIRGVLLEHGEKTQSLSEMNVSGNALQIFHRLVEAADDPYLWSSLRAPTLVFEDVQFSGT